VLTIFDSASTTRHEVHTDASDKAMGACLLQRKQDESAWRPVAYFSRKLNSAQQNYNATDKELLAIVEALQYWRHYLHGQDFVVKTDHQPLRYFFSKPNLSGR